MLHGFYDVKQTSFGMFRTRVAPNKSTRFNAAALSPMHKGGGAGGWGGAGQRDTRHNDVNAWALQSKQSESSYRKSIVTQIYITQKYIEEKKKLRINYS